MRLYRQGLSTCEIARRLGVTKANVRYLRAAANGKKPRSTYQIKDITDTMPIEIDSEGRQYQCPAVALISPSGSIRKFPDDEFFDFLRQLDDEIEMHAAFQFRMLFDKAKNLYKWKV